MQKIIRFQLVVGLQRFYISKDRSAERGFRAQMVSNDCNWTSVENISIITYCTVSSPARVWAFRYARPATSQASNIDLAEEEIHKFR